MKKKLILLVTIVAILSCLFAIVASAEVIGDIDYTLDTSNKIATVSANNKSIAIEHVVIPATVTAADGNVYNVTKIANSAFEGNKTIKSVTFEGALASFGQKVFQNCTSLEYFNYPLDKATFTQIGQYSFNGCSSFKGFNNENGITFHEGFTTIQSACAFTNCDQITFVNFPSTINYVGQAAFSYCDNLKIVSFDKVNEKIVTAMANGQSYKKVDFNNCGTFKGCKNLVAISVPEGTTEIINRFLAEKCTSLTAVYLPNSVVSFGTNGGGQGPFCDATNMYFVQESFTVGQCIVNGSVDLTKLSLPEKPDVYYMPTSLTTLKGHVESNAHSKHGTMFQNCTSINDTIVFGANFVNFNANNIFNGMGSSAAPKTVAFLGDIQSYVTTQNSKYVSFVFLNPADKTPSDLGIYKVYKPNNISNSYMYFCATGAKYSFAQISVSDSDKSYSNEYNAVYSVEYDNAYNAIYDAMYQKAYDELYQSTYDEAYKAAYDAAIADGAEEEAAKEAADTAAKTAAEAAVKAKAEEYAAASAKETATPIATAAGNAAKAAAIAASTVFAANETKHIHNPDLDSTQAATCLLPAGEFTFCYCGSVMTSVVVDGSVALGHVVGNDLKISYPVTDGVTDFFQNAIHSYTCQREGCGIKVDEVKAESALFTEKGYSKETYEGGNAFTYGIKLNKDAEKEYVDNGNVVSYGFIIGAETDSGTNGNIMNADGTTNLQKYVLTDFAVSAYETFSIYNVRMFGLDETQLSQSVYCCAYVIDNGEVYYVGEAVTKQAIMVSYDGIYD